MARKSLWLGLLLTLVFLALAFRGIDAHGLTQALARAHYAYLLPAVLFTGGGYLVRTARWRVILGAGSRLPFWRLTGVLVVGFAANNVLPTRLGEAVRAMLLQRQGRVRAAFGLATIVLERVADGLTLLLILVVLGVFDAVPGSGGQLDAVELVAGTVFLGAGLVIAVALARGELVGRLVALLARPLPSRLGARIVSLARAFLDGLQGVRSGRRLVAVALLSAAVWALEGCSYFVLSAGFDMPLALPQQVALACTVLVLVNLSIMIPSAPGYVGTFDFVAKSSAMLFGVPVETALAYAIVSHAMQYVLVTGAGAFFLGREHLSLATLFRQARPVAPAAAVGTEEPAEGLAS
jgi:uncharacterized protein (TIRG00374 family)